MRCLGKISIQVSHPFFKSRLFVFWMLSCMICLYILDINLLLVISLANIFSHLVGCLSFYWWFPLWGKSFLSLIEWNVVTQLCLTLCDPMDCSLPGSSIHWIFQARILEWVTIYFSRRSSQPRNWIQVSHIVGRRFTVWATSEVTLSLIRSHLFLFAFISFALGDVIVRWVSGIQFFVTPWASRLPCPSSPIVSSNSCPLSQWCHPSLFSSCLQSFPASGSFPVNQLFASDGPSIRASALVLPMNIQGWFPLGLTSFISLQSKGLSKSSLES